MTAPTADPASLFIQAVAGDTLTAVTAPVAALQVKAPIGRLVFTTPEVPGSIPETAAAWLYDTTGRRLIGQITTAIGIVWQHRVNQPGSGTFAVLLDDPLLPQIVERSIVKFSLYGAIRFAVVIRSEGSNLAVDGAGNRTVSFDQQPDILSLLNAGTVLPEKTLTRASDDVARLGFMYSTSSGNWFTSAEWGAPHGYRFNADPSTRRGKPADFAPYGDTCMWIAKGAPDATQPDNTVQFFRSTFHTNYDQFIRIIVAFDDFGTMWMDGNELATPDYQNGQSWTQAQTIDYHLPAGPHEWCVKLENAPAIPGHSNPVAFIAAIVLLDPSGNPTNLVNYTDLSRWKVYTGTGEPGFHRGQMLAEAISRMHLLGDVTDLNMLTPTFTTTADSNGDPWADDKVSERTFEIGRTGIADMATELCSDGTTASLDVWAGAEDMTVNASNRVDGTTRQGSDVSGSVELTLGSGPDGVLVTYQTTKTYTRFTAALVQRADRSWVEIDDAAGRAARGRIFTSMQLGSTTSEKAAEDQAGQALQDSARPVTSVTAEATAYAVDGPKAYLDYNPGDTVTAPGHRGIGTIKARVLEITVDASTDVVRTYPSQMVEDLSV